MRTVFVPALLLLTAAVQAAPAPAISAFDPFQVLAGRWKLQFLHADSSPGSTFSLSADCWQGYRFYSCEDDIRGGEPGKPVQQDELRVFTYDAVHGVYSAYTLYPAGKNLKPRRFSIQGSAWIFPGTGPGKDDAHRYYRERDERASADSVDVWEEYSSDGKAWPLSKRIQHWSRVSAVTATPPVPKGGLDALAAYAGNWRGEIEYLDTPYSKAAKDTNRLLNDCRRVRVFYACEQIVDGDPKALLVFTYDAKTHSYTSRPVPTDGGAAGAGKLLIKGAVWTFPWDNSEGGKTVHFRVVNTWSSHDSIEFRQEYSADGVHWTLMADGHETRVTDSVKP